MMDDSEVYARGIELARDLYTPECFELLAALVRQLGEMNYGNTNDDIDDLLQDPNAEDTLLQSTYVEAIIKRDVFSAIDTLGITLNQDTPLHDCKKLLDALFLLPYLEDPLPYIRMLESDTGDQEELLAKLLEDLTNIGMDNWMSYIESISPSLIDRMLSALETQATKQEPEAEQEAYDPRYVQQLKDYAELFGKDTLGYKIATSGIILNMPMETYLSYFKEELQEDQPETFAQHLLGILLLGSDTWQNPLEGFRRESENLVKAPEMIRRIEQGLMKSLNDFHQFRRAKDDAPAVSAVQP